MGKRSTLTAADVDRLLRLLAMMRHNPAYGATEGRLRAATGRTEGADG